MTTLNAGIAPGERCPRCGRVVPKKRSVEISTHFHAHVTQIAREEGQDRKSVYMECLVRAHESVADGGAPYPAVIVGDSVVPWRTSWCNNKQMMTAVFATHLLAAELGILLNENPEEWEEHTEE